jgi:hypothetical protein
MSTYLEDIHLESRNIGVVQLPCTSFGPSRPRVLIGIFKDHIMEVSVVTNDIGPLKLSASYITF